MIELRTGIPGSGKSLSLVEALAKLLESWGKNPELGRPVFVHNIKELALPHAVMPTKDVQIGNQLQNVPDWDLMPDGSLVIIDECQDVLPPRSSQSKPPPYIAWFNTHRHKGFDIWLVTQHPKLIDGSVRALVGKHVHFRRLFGGQRAATYEWDACSDSLSGMKNAVLSYYSFPKKAMRWYKSAEIHTKQSFKLPRWLLIPFFGVVLGAFMIPNAYKTLSSTVGGKGLSTAAVAPVPALPASLPRPSQPLPLMPVASVSPLVPASAPSFAGCGFVANKCSCFDSTGHSVEPRADICASFSVGRVLTSSELPGHDVSAKPSPDVSSLVGWVHRRRTESDYVSDHQVSAL